MGFHSIYYKNFFNSLILSKIIIKSLTLIPNIKKIILYFIIQSKEYKKNLLLFYIIICLIVSAAIIKKKEVSGLTIFKITLKKKKTQTFLLSFIYFYVQQLFLYILFRK